MTDDIIPDPEAEPTSAERLAELRLEVAEALIKGVAGDFGPLDVMDLIALIDTQAARIAELEAERADHGWLPRDRGEVDRMFRESAAMRAMLDRALATPGAFIVAD